MGQSFEHNEGHVRIARVVDYIFRHYDEDVSLETLAGVGHYSIDHLPKLFKEMVGETPKQYSLALRLEAAFHYLVIRPEKPVQEIALEGGFSSLGVFSRAVKIRFGYSPEEIRRLPHSRQMRLLHGVSKPAHDRTGVSAATAGASKAAASRAGVDEPEVQVVRREVVKGIYVTARFDDPEKIRAAFRALYALGRGADGPGTDEEFYGILTPHLRNTYRAFRPLAMSVASSDGIRGHSHVDRLPTVCSAGEIKGGMFARFTVSGDLRATNKAAHYFYRQWLPASGFRIAGIAGFERLDGNPAEIPYDLLTRIIHIPIASIK